MSLDATQHLQLLLTLGHLKNLSTLETHEVINWRSFGHITLQRHRVNFEPWQFEENSTTRGTWGEALQGAWLSFRPPAIFNAVLQCASMF